MTTPVLLPEAAFGLLPDGLRKELLAAFGQIVTNYRLHRWEASELNGGKLCEITHTILKGIVDGVTFPSKASKPRNMVEACRSMEQAPKTHPHSVRIGLPRLLVALYDIRNNRSVGHVGGDVDPNHMDSELVLGMAKWAVAELVRIFHDVSVQEATEVVEALSAREIPVVWDSGKVKRVMDPNLDTKTSVLLLLYASGDHASVSDLLAWLEYGNASRFRSSILKDLHRERYVEYDKSDSIVSITPKGSRRVETELPKVVVG